MGPEASGPPRSQLAPGPVNGVSDAAWRDVAHILKHAYRPFEEVADLLQALLDALVEHKRFALVEAHLSGDTRPRQLRSFPATRAAPVAGGADASTRSLAYRELTFGHLMVLADAPEGGEPERQFLDAFAHVVGLLLQRYEVRAKARALLGYDLWFVGVAPGLLRLEERLEHVAALPMPLLIQGEFGCEARAAAFAAYVASARAGPFVELRCGEAGDAAAFKVELERLSHAIERGTLFLSDVDELDLPHQKQLAEFLAPCAAPPLSPLVDAVARHTAPFRVIASTSRSLSSLAGHGGFSKILWTILDYLRLRIPPLRERREDIPFFIEYCAAVFGQHERTFFSPEAAAILTAWNWSGNLSELERTLARLLVTADTSVIDIDNLREWAAELLADAPLASCDSANGAPGPAALDEEPLASLGHQHPLPLALAQELLIERFDRIESFHPGLQRALRHLAHHFHEEIALERLARESFVSPSYLCALFKKTLGMGFKRFQSILRVEKAKEMLVRSRHQRITDISLDVGFGDFSHFLRTFKRFVHISPREFRKRHPLDSGTDRVA